MSTSPIFRNERGVSLVEIVASIALISIVLVAISGLFLQSKKSTVSSETIVESTYVAQQMMEEVYFLTKTLNLQQLQDYYIEQNGTLIHSPTPNTPELTVQVPFSQPAFTTQLQFIQLDHPKTAELVSSTAQLYNVIITVYEHGQQKSTMENIISIQ